MDKNHEKSCKYCEWCNTGYLEKYGNMRCDYHGFFSVNGKIPKITCDEFRKKEQDNGQATN